MGRPQPVPQDPEEEPAPPQYTDIKALRKTDFADTVEAIALLQEKRREIETQIKDLNVNLKNLLIKGDTKTVMVDYYRVTLCEGKSVQLSREKLLEQGVSTKVIQKATVISTYTYPKVTDTFKKKEEE